MTEKQTIVLFTNRLIKNGIKVPHGFEFQVKEFIIKLTGVL